MSLLANNAEKKVILSFTWYVSLKHKLRPYMLIFIARVTSASRR